MKKLWGLVFTVAVVVLLFNIAVAAIEPFMPLIGISIAIIVVLATAWLVWRIVSVRTKRFW